MEEPVIYNVESTEKIRPETLRAFSDGWEQPTKEEIRTLLKQNDLTGAKAAKIEGVNSRTVRKWTGGERGIPYAAWRLILISCDLV